MSLYDFETPLDLNNDGNTTPAVLDPFTVTLDVISGGRFQLNPLVKDSAAYAHLAAGGADPPVSPAINFAYISNSQQGLFPARYIYGQGWPFGMEPQEYLSWWYDGGGAALVYALTEAPNTVYPFVLFPICVRTGDNGGWFKEPLTLQKMMDGKYATGEQMNFRFFDVGERAIDLAFPNIITPPSTAAVTPIGDIANGKFNGVKINEPIGDASPGNPAAGLFPNWPSVTGSVIDFGLKHYYKTSWHTPTRLRWIAVNKTFYNVVLTAAERAQIDAAARSAAMQNLASCNNGTDAMIETFQSMGAIIHEAWPQDITQRLRHVTPQVHNTSAAADATGTYQAVLDHIRAFMKANQVSWRDHTNRFFRTQQAEVDAQLHPDRMMSLCGSGS